MFPVKLSGIQRQLASALISAMTSFIYGTLVGWSAPTLKKLREPDSPIHLTPAEEVQMINAIYAGTLLGTFPCGALMNRVGRKGSLLLLSAFPITSWSAIYFARTASMLLIARFFAGVWGAAAGTIRPIYVAEIAEPRVRGAAGAFTMVAMFAGTIFVFVVGPCVSIQTMAIINGVAPPIFFLLFSLCPESPYYYIMRGRHADAARTLAWLRGGAPIESELTSIQTSIEREAKAGQGYFRKMLSLVTVPANRKAFFIVEVMNFLQRVCGLSCMAAYSTVVLPQRLGPLTADHCTLIIGIVWFLSSLGCSTLVDKLGRKPLLYVSSIGILASMLPTSAWYYLDKETTMDVTWINWVPLAGFLLFGVTVNVGLGSIAPTYMGEMFPSNLKAEASALTIMAVSVSSSVSIAVFALLTAHVGLYANFLVFAAVGAVNWVFTYFCVIETKGKSLQLIQDELHGGTHGKPSKNNHSDGKLTV
ncbi:unnamed protein product [Bemisia tabaci]|uniref:Major facilitator superfamily (MFS) profile domain-containing protein n=1 Tax=Bemisia tabaci TaxID=7038 RepID=A0A9P0F8D9_BEMTA|nr:unnamed protein product [Bemisia tabaci]